MSASVQQATQSQDLPQAPTRLERWFPIAAAEDTINAAYADAAAALLAAELIDEANLNDAAVVIANAWVVEEV